LGNKTTKNQSSAERFGLNSALSTTPLKVTIKGTNMLSTHHSHMKNAATGVKSPVTAALINIDGSNVNSNQDLCKETEMSGIKVGN
jgi:hypothetical protein